LESSWRWNVADEGLNYYNQGGLDVPLTLISRLLPPNDFYWISNAMSAGLPLVFAYPFGGSQLEFAGLYTTPAGPHFPYGLEVEPDG